MSDVNLAVSPVKIAPNVWHVGMRMPGQIFYSNPYLCMFPYKDDCSSRISLLVDPGSSSDIAIVQSKCTKVMGDFKSLSAMFINHQDPDVGTSSTVILGRHAPKAMVITSDEVWRLLQNINIPKERFISTNKYNYPKGFSLPSGHKLFPVPSPFCHFAGAVGLYDPESKVLFSGDFLGGLSDTKAEGIWATEDDWVGIRAFHQAYMPANLALRHMVQSIRALRPEVEVIAPQHGRVIKGDLIDIFLDRMEQLEVGVDLLELDDGGDAAGDESSRQAWTTVLQRVINMANMLTGEKVESMLSASTRLQDVIDEAEGVLSIIGSGRSAIERVLNLLGEELGEEIVGPVIFEAIAAAEEFGLPSPRVEIESLGAGSGSQNGGTEGGMELM